ncbi:MAG TPA: hypothetical protein VFZ19_06410 [Solirubrobacterales bacterium]
MEALLEKEGQVESWNDDRLDELSRRMDAGFEKAATKEEMNLRFDEVDRRFDEVYRRFDEIGGRFGEVSAQFAHINDRLDRMNNTLLVGAFGVIAATIANGIWG